MGRASENKKKQNENLLKKSLVVYVNKIPLLAILTFDNATYIIKQNVSFHPVNALEDGLGWHLPPRVQDNGHTCVMQVQIDFGCLTGPKHACVSALKIKRI